VRYEAVGEASAATLAEASIVMLAATG